MKKRASREQGFIQIIALIIVFVVIVLFIGKSPMGVWNEYVKPLLTTSVSLLMQGIEFVISLVTAAWQKSH